ncbi:MAG: baseplate J/gp47 family protein [Devosia sp.]|nr:baseplate J/gp47 family protein [Devosia sp.]
MAIVTKNFTTLLQDQAAAIQGASSTLLDFSIGSVLRAISESNSAIVLWLQGLILQLLTATRAATSSGSDLDSWVNDFGVSRLPATAATGNANFSRFTATAQAIIPIGTQVQTADGTQTFTVYVDSTNIAYSALLGGYVIQPGVSTLPVPVQANTSGAAGNVVANSVALIFSPISGVDSVTNTAAFSGGADAESDAALRTRFVAFIGSLSKSTKSAIGYAIASIQQGLDYTITENQTLAGVYTPGTFFVVIDDGSGAPPAALLTTTYLAIDPVRPIGTSFAVYGPAIVTAAVSCTLTTATGYAHASVVAAVIAAMTNYINDLPLGSTLFFTKLAQLAYEASSGVVNVSSLTLNGGTADLTASASQVIKAGVVTVS